MKELSGITPKTLTDTLAVLRREGFVGRREKFSLDECEGHCRKTPGHHH
jgi:hypothetical protein